MRHETSRGIIHERPRLPTSANCLEQGAIQPIMTIATQADIEAREPVQCVACTPGPM